MSSINAATAATVATVNRPQNSALLVTNDLANTDKQVSVVAAPAAAIFNYDALPAHDTDLLRESAERIRANVRRTTAAILEIGRDLLKAKERLDHGQFSAWVDAECGFGVRSAERYITAAKLAEGKNDTVSLLPLATVYRLAAKSTPPAVIEAVISRVEAGEVLSYTVVKEMIHAGKPEQRPAKRDKKRHEGERGRDQETPGQPGEYLLGPSHTCRRIQQAIWALAGQPSASEVCRYLEQEADLALLIDERLEPALLWLQELANARRAAQDAREAAP
jgi:hypothetical protein